MHRTKLSRWITAPLSGVLLLASGSLAVAQHSISDAEARAIALRAVPGEVVEIEHERAILEVIVRDRQGRLRGVEIDRATGRVMDIEDEEDDDEEVDEG